MSRNQTRSTIEEADLLEFLVSLPVRNLESKITFLNSELKGRISLSNDLLDGINAKVREIEGTKWRLRYSDPHSHSLQNIESHLAEKERQKSLELTACFKDCLDLKQQLEHSRADLRKAKAKLRLLKS